MPATAPLRFPRSSFAPLQYAACFAARVLPGLLEPIARPRTAGPRAPAWALVRADAVPLHHSVAQKETGSNLGAIVTWRERIYGTDRTGPTELARLRLGLEKCRDARTTSLSWLLVLPFIRLAPLGADRPVGAVAAASARGAGAG
jgi:hypothetical protein